MDDDEIDRLTAENSELQRKLFDQEIEQAEGNTRRAVIHEATKRNLDPEACYKLLDLSEVDSENPETISKALDRLVVDKPFLAGRTGPPPSPGTPPHGGQLPRPPMSSNEAWLAMLKGGKGR